MCTTLTFIAAKQRKRKCRMLVGVVFFQIRKEEKLKRQWYDDNTYKKWQERKKNVEYNFEFVRVCNKLSIT
jgi:hypothetical protein